MKKTLFAMILILAFISMNTACSGPQVKGPATAKELRAMSGAHALEGAAIIVYFEQQPEPEARALYQKLVALGMRELRFEPGFGTGGAKMIMHRPTRLDEAKWLKTHVWELKEYGVAVEDSATDIYINTW